MIRYIFCVLLAVFFLSMFGCKDVMDKMNESQYFENGVFDITYWDQSLWVDNVEPEIEPDEEIEP
ncbi:MAG: hypothetical protein FWF73_01475 [Spirochaetes bacterium]|nr:hypothetical protein [Spirochaetota bacterium]